MPGSVADRPQTVSRPHYWWLAYKWENLYLACQACAVAAGAQFPVEGVRARIGAEGQLLEREERMLLDPCHDDPELDLEFGQDGTVTGRGRRGQLTIAIFALNRSPLVKARQEAIAAASTASPGYLQDPARPYAGALRGVYGSLEAARVEPSGWSWLKSLGGRLREALSLGTHVPPPVGPVVVERLELRNFRSIGHLELDLARPEDEACWTMLLGENGRGKTSVLWALALVLMGQEARDRLPLDAKGLVRRGEKEAEIIAYLRGALEPRRLRIAFDGGRFEVDGEDYPLAVAAYGVARVPSTRGWRRRGKTTGRPRVENLFDPASPLVAADHWLAERDEPSFDFCARAIRRLLLEPESTVVERKDGRVVLSTPDGPSDLGQLSDGYRSMIAFGCRHHEFLQTRYGSMDAAQGVVLVDEIGAHLHPRWQMRVVEAFRDAFPRLQFVVTTHDPLCLRGLTGARDVVVLRRTDDGQVYSLPREEIPSVRGLRVDELLTSEVFGLRAIRLFFAVRCFVQLVAGTHAPQHPRRLEKPRILNHTPPGKRQGVAVLVRARIDEDRSGEPSCTAG